MSVAVAIAIIIGGIGVPAGALDRYTRWIYRRGQGSIRREVNQAQEAARIQTLETEISNLKAKLDSMLRRSLISIPSSAGACAQLLLRAADAACRDIDPSRIQSAPTAN